jgi:hypothetical protein
MYVGVHNLLTRDFAAIRKQIIARRLVTFFNFAFGNVDQFADRSPFFFGHFKYGFNMPFGYDQRMTRGFWKFVINKVRQIVFLYGGFG